MSSTESSDPTTPSWLREALRPNPSTPIAVHEALTVLAYFGDHRGVQPSHFTQALLKTIGRADPDNQARLALGFPGYVAAHHLAANTPDGMHQLLLIAYPPEATQ
jgi:hypothetical protein